MTDINSRMEKVVRDIASRKYVSESLADRAKAIVAELDGPKSDEEWAAKLWADGGNNDTAINFAKTCIAKGRELAHVTVANNSPDVIEVLVIDDNNVAVRLKDGARGVLPGRVVGIAAPKDGTRIQNVGISDKWDDPFEALKEDSRSHLKGKFKL